MTEYVLTRARLSSRAPNLAALLTEAGGKDLGHKLVWTLFPDEPGATRDFLFRATGDRDWLVLSRRKPADPHGLWSLETKPYEPGPALGEHYTFLLRANPAVAVRSRDGKRGHRADAVMHAKTRARADPSESDKSGMEPTDAGLEWLMKREASLGVRFDRESCSTVAYRQMRIPRRGDKPIRFSTIDYEGRLEVTDPPKLVAALFGGIGKARAFGCGLMLIKRTD